ncbi:hypothetical protein D3C71_1906870 [compost metagenome]
MLGHRFRQRAATVLVRKTDIVALHIRQIVMKNVCFKNPKKHGMRLNGFNALEVLGQGHGVIADIRSDVNHHLVETAFFTEVL